MPAPLGRLRPASLGVFAVLVMAGMLFAVSATTARGTQLRTDRSDAAALARSEQARYAALLARLAALRREVDERTRAAAGGDATVRDLRARGDALATGAGLAPVQGHALRVVLDDAPRRATLPVGITPDDLVVHQQDVQAVVNALWLGGAEAMMLMDQRVISTSAVRCVGNTLLLQGQVYSPPYRISAIGDPARLRGALDSSAALQIYREFSKAYGLGWSVQDQGDVTFPAFTGSLDLRFATPLPAPSDAPSSPANRAPTAARSSAPAP
ncbi:MAG TPA: DUF881 domain-containing protein [Kineosporiaceae bacterium]|nr:DUF881 domain-containing protein [Kineosporiaceae bacterium]